MRIPPSESATRCSVVLLVALAPVLLTLALVPGFITQDGPAHLYNAQILRNALGRVNPGQGALSAFEVRWRPVPNWAGHLGLAGLMSLLPPLIADRVMLGATLLGPAFGVLWLRRRVAGPAGAIPSALLAAMLAMNVAWLFGFSSFLLGATLFPFTLGIWWAGRDRLGPWRVAGLAGLLVIGFFCHLISTGLTAVALLILAIASPGPRRGRRLAATLGALLPVIPLGLAYQRLMRATGRIEPQWMVLKEPFSPACWWAQLGWVDPISLSSKRLAPFVTELRAIHGLAAPVLWFGLGLAVLVGDTIRRHGWGGERRGWALLAAVLIAGGLAGPDALGPAHGNYLAMRVLLFGLIALVPWLDVSWDRPLVRLATVTLLIAAAIQNLFIVDYARRADPIARTFLAARSHLRPGQRVGTLLINPRTPFRANPLLHADNLLGIGADAVIWNNYEATEYYFPVQVRPDVPHPPLEAFEDIAILDAPGSAAARAAAWSALLDQHRDQIDILAIWGEEPDQLDPISTRHYQPLARVGPLRLLLRRADQSLPDP